ncbi:MAG: type I restriction endonuclease subunit R [Deltaproteobacteria bacterium]|nr:type I restriction endonuclease subunit R [Deltaproteobacteria bacterium]
MSPAIYESDVEEFALAQLAALGYDCINGEDIAPEEPAAERTSFAEVVLRGRLEEALRRLNPDVPQTAIDEAVRKVTVPDGVSLLQNNRTFHRMLRDGVEVEIAGDKGEVLHPRLQLVDFDDADENDWLAVNQFTIVEGHHNRRPDVILFVNGLPLVLFELKNLANETATIQDAYQQIQTYKQQIPSLFVFNELVVLSDGFAARVGTFTAPWERYAPWRTVDGQEVAPKTVLEQKTLIDGIFDKRRLLELLKSFIVFEDDKNGTVKKLAAYHQVGAVREAINQTVRATRPSGDRKVGVVWHTQGSGKSLTMAFYAARVVDEPAMENPTIVVITDRNDLDDQLFGTFARCAELLRNTPVQARDRDHLHELLAVASGGVVFTTIQKFLPEEKGEKFPELSPRRNIVVIADEAHRSQYGFKAKLVKDKDGGYLVPGFAQHMRDALPNASFIGFTGTPIELTDKNTRAVFGDYISVYDIQRAVEDGATVPIYYESRLAKLSLDADQRAVIDDEFEEITEQEEDARKEKLKSRWAALEAVVGDEKRVTVIAEDIVQHLERRLEGMKGKAMIVCMSRRICVAMYNAIKALRPAWAASSEPDDDDASPPAQPVAVVAAPAARAAEGAAKWGKPDPTAPSSDSPEDLGGQMKVIMTGSAADPLEWQPHIRSKTRLEKLADRFRDANDPLKLVIVRDMWLTGFDAPSMHTLYVDKPMQGHGLMQAIARVNRVWGDKPGGLVVDYLGLADNLRKALATYTQAGGKGETAVSQAEAIAIMLEKLEACRDFFHGFDYGKFLHGNRFERLMIIPHALEHVYASEDGRDRIVDLVAALEKAFGLALGSDEAMIARDEVAFFQTIKAAVLKSSVSTAGRSRIEVETAIRQIVSKALVADRVIDVFEAAGLKKPDVSILSEDFLAEIKDLPQKHLAVELLKKLLNDDIQVRRKKNLVQSEAFSDKLEKTILRYRNRAIETVQVIEELIGLAKDVQSASKRGVQLNLSEDELAFYDALETNDSAVAVLGDKVLTKIARELTQTIRNSVTLDWTVKETVRAKLRTLVRRQLKKHGYPPDKTEKAVETVLRQAEMLAADWAGT